MKSMQELEQKKRNSISGIANQPTSVVVLDSEIDPSKPPTPMRKLDAAIANAVDFDLGDF